VAEAHPAQIREPDARRQALRGAIAAHWEGVRFVAENLLGAESRIDFVTVVPEGETRLVLVGEARRDLELVARGLAQRAWVEARLCDWLQLAPELGARPESGVSALLLCPAFGAEAIAAAAGCADPGRIHLATLYFAGAGPQLRAWIAPMGRPGARSEVARPRPATEFRTGLSDADLGLSPEERAALEQSPTGNSKEIVRLD
jgi:hypothetical protein